MNRHHYTSAPGLSGLSGTKYLSDHTLSLILFGAGVFLTLCELSKQFILYYIINERIFDWWFFPFHLCSIPMYLCLILPFISAGPFKTICYTFMQDYSFVGGIAALVIPLGFTNIHWYITTHGYLWHVILIAISLLIAGNKNADKSWHGFLKTLPLFLICCIIATGINCLPAARGRANMFYISPYVITTQPVFHEISLYLGILPGHILYLITVGCGAALTHQIFISFGPSLGFRRILERITKGGKYQKI